MRARRIAGDVAVLAVLLPVAVLFQLSAASDFSLVAGAPDLVLIAVCAVALARGPELGCLAGVAINPGTPVEAVSELEGLADLVLCMTVNPGWGGQPFIAHSLVKLPRVRAIIGDDAALEVDGGIDPQTAPQCAQAGANVFVAGSAIFHAKDPAAAYTAIATAIDAE